MKSKIELPIIQDPLLASSENPSCVRCKLHETCQKPFMPMYIPAKWSGKLLCVGEAPGGNEDQSGRPFVGKAGKLLYELFGSVGIRPEDVALTNANRCRPVNNATPTSRQVKLCRPFLASDILTSRPRWILALGNNAARSIFVDGTVPPIKKLRQRCYNAEQFFGEAFEGVKVGFTYHPASAFYPSKKGKDTIDLKAAILSDLEWMVRFKSYLPEPEDSSPNPGKMVSIDVEWDREYKLLTVGRAWGDKAQVTEDKAVWSDWFQELSDQPQNTIATGHGIFQDLAVVRLNQIPLRSDLISGKATYDTVLAARMVDENLSSYDLESLGASMCSVAPWKLESDALLKKQKIKDFWDIPADIRQRRCRLDAWTGGLLADKLSEKTDPRRVEFNNRLGALLWRVHMSGVKISEDRYNKLGSILQRHLVERSESIKNLALRWGMEEYTPSNDNHFRELLYDKIKATPVKFTEKDKLPSVDDTALTLIYQLGSSDEKEAILARLRYEKADKLFSTYIGVNNDEEEKGLAKFLSQGHYVFPTIKPFGTRTGRRSSVRPNIQNWPKRMRSMVVSRYPTGRIVKGDEGQLEPRILAWVAGIEEWQDIFSKGKSLYLEVSKRLWGKTISKESQDYKLTKSTVLGTNYGMEVDLFVEKLATEQGIYLSREEGTDLLNRYFRAYPQLPRYFAKQKEFLLKHQTAVEYITGHVRHLPCPEGEKTKGFKHLWNQALNHPIQSLASYVVGSALMDLEEAILSRISLPLTQHYDNLIRFWAQEKLSLDNLEERGILKMGQEIDYPLIIGEVHDEIIVDTPGQDRAWVVELLNDVMTSIPSFRRTWVKSNDLFLTAEVSDGVSWAGK